MGLHKVLIVDDHEQFRRLIRLTLSQRTDFQIVGEASDGLNALEKAQKLQPDLILMDLGLPKLDGMEATRLLRTLVPHARILIISQESSSDVVRESLRSGAAGYVHKPHLHGDLIPAIEGVLQGKQFVSSGLAGDIDGEASRHELLFCSNDAALLDGLARFISRALNAGNPVMALVTRPHRVVLLEKLRASGVDIAAAIERRLFVTWNADELPAPTSFEQAIMGLAKTALQAGKEHPRVAFCGERAGRLWAKGKVDEATQLERFCHELGDRHEVDILCVYPLWGGQGESQAINSIRAEHTAVSFQ
jgi:DNA-binding NarL/FixJ family response regulator